MDKPTFIFCENITNENTILYGKNIWIVGGGELAGQFFDLGLLDEIILNIAPVMLLTGAPLLPRKIITPALQLNDVKKYGDAFARLTYKVKNNDN